MTRRSRIGRRTQSFPRRLLPQPRNGIVPAGPEGLRLGAEAVLERLTQLHRDGGLFRLSVQRLFEMVRDRFDLRGVQILTPASASKEFLLGDIPALTVDRAANAVGLAQGVTADHADEIFMPLAPRLLVSVGPPDGARSIPDDEVDQYKSQTTRSTNTNPRRRGRPIQPVASPRRPGLPDPPARSQLPPRSKDSRSASPARSARPR